MRGKAVLVTGASRGIGAAVAKLLAAQGADVALTYRSKAPRAEAVAAAVRALGARALALQADLTDFAAMERMAAAFAAEFGTLDVLVLNASGGLERNMPPGYALRLNRDAQAHAVALAVPLMPRGGRIVFLTSHPAHFYGSYPCVPEYEPVARSKHAGELALRARIAELDARGIGLVVVSSDIVEGTITAGLLERARRGLLDYRRGQVDRLPTVDELAAAVADAATSDGRPSGTTIYVGSTAVGAAFDARGVG